MAADPARSAVIRDRLLRGTLSNCLGKFATVGIWFFLTPFILERLGPAGYGLWVLMGSLAAYGYLLDFGIGGAIVKYVAEHRARGEPQQANRLIATALWLYLALGLAAVAGGIALAGIVPDLFGVAATERASTAQAVALTGVLVGLTIAFAPAITVLQGLQRYDLHVAINVGGSLLTAGLTVLVLSLGYGVVAMIAAGIPVTILMRLAALRLIRRIAPELRFRWRGGDPHLVPQILHFSASSFAIQISGRLNSKTDELVIAAFLPVSAVAPYALGRKLGELAQVVAQQFVKIIIPLASELDARDDGSRLRRLYLATSRLTLAVHAPVSLVLMVLAGPILTAWVGPDYAEASSVVVLLAVAGLIGTSQAAGSSILQGIARHRMVAMAMLAGGVANVAMSIALVHVLGIVGVALATLITVAVVSLGVVLPCNARILGAGARECLREIWVPGLLPALVAGGVLVLLREWRAPASVLQIALVAACGVAVYAAVYLSLAGTRQERATLRHAAVTAYRLATGTHPAELRSPTG